MYFLAVVFLRLASLLFLNENRVCTVDLHCHLNAFPKCSAATSFSYSH